MRDLGIGKIIPYGQPAQRDAIHVAVYPAIAGERLKPGDRVSVDSSGYAMKNDSKPIGIVDPFIAKDIIYGERFWLFMDPRVGITSPRHDWSHPDVPDEAPRPEPDYSEADYSDGCPPGCG